MFPFKYGNLTSIGALLSEVSESTCAQPLLPHYHSVTVLVQVTEKNFFFQIFFLMLLWLDICFSALLFLAIEFKKKKKLD